jgi:phosphoserine phosphatase RsbU/P
MKILIAEDDQTTRYILETLLDSWGYQVVSVKDGIAALNEFSKEDAPPIAIIDWQMPELNGLEVCKKIAARNNGASTYTILLTGRDKNEDIVEGLCSGANDYITKPFNDKELKARIQVAERVINIQSSLSEKIAELEGAVKHIKTLQGILPICMHCHKIRNDQEAWEKLESYLSDHAEIEFSHSICPTCLHEIYPEYSDSEED